MVPSLTHEVQDGIPLLFSEADCILISSLNCALTAGPHEVLPIFEDFGSFHVFATLLIIIACSLISN